MFLCLIAVSGIGTDSSTDPSQIHPKLRWWRFRRHLNAPPDGLVSDLHSDLAAHIQHVWGFDITWSSGPLKNNFLCVEIGAPWWKIRVWCESRISWVAIEHVKSVYWLYLYIYPAMSVTNTLKSEWKLLRFSNSDRLFIVLSSGIHYFFATSYLDTWLFFFLASICILFSAFIYFLLVCIFSQNTEVFKYISAAFSVSLSPETNSSPPCICSYVQLLLSAAPISLFCMNYLAHFLSLYSRER